MKTEKIRKVFEIMEDFCNTHERCDTHEQCKWCPFVNDDNGCKFKEAVGTIPILFDDFMDDEPTCAENAQVETVAKNATNIFRNKLMKIKDYIGGFSDVFAIEDGVCITGLKGTFSIMYDFDQEDYIVSGDCVSVTELTDIIRILNEPEQEE
ncbi:MAG: hypothetical protein MJ068_04700 [Clostridia bacterium]|nr:hypothetical protein [Clostridia bacterium]